MDKVCTGCGRFESDGPIGNTFLSCCPDSDYQEIGCNMKDLIVFYKSQAKEIEGLRDKERIMVNVLHRVHSDLSLIDRMDVITINRIIEQFLSQGTTQPDKGGERNADKTRQHRTE